MTLVDDIIKWFKAPKTIKGIVGMIAIVILLAADFAYWAGAIDVDDQGGGSNGGGDDEIEIPDDYVESITDSLPRGSHIAPQVPNLLEGEAEGETYRLYPIPIEYNRSEVTITCDGDPGSPQRLDGGDRNDLDLYLYSEGNDASGDLDSTSPDYQAATAQIAETFNDDDLDPGNWTLRVDCYTGDDVSYTVDIQVIYTRGNQTEEEEGE